MNPEDSGPTPLNPRSGPGPEGEVSEPEAPAAPRSESAISNEAQAVRTLASAHRLAGEIENAARRKADEIAAQAELHASQHEAEGRARAEAIIAAATAERDRIWSQIREGVGKATRQVGELLAIREELRLDLHEALRDSGSALNRLEDGEEAEPTRPAPPAWLPGDAPGLPAAPDASAPSTGTASETESMASPAPRPMRGSPLSPGRGAGSAPPAEQQAAPPAPDSGPVLSSLRAGPFESFLAVMRFERELAGAEPIDAVYVRRFANGEVDVEVESHGGADALATALTGIPEVDRVEHAGGAVRVRMRPDAAPRE